MSAYITDSKIQNNNQNIQNNNQNIQNNNTIVDYLLPLTVTEKPQTPLDSVTQPLSKNVGYLTQNDLLYTTLIQFFAVDSTGLTNPNLDIMLDIINGQSKISLRLLDWFVTNYSKKYFTTYYNHDNTRFKVYNNYKLKLKSYSKTRFDPFCRWQRISFPYKHNLHVETTIGQLNFFKWAIQNKVIHYILHQFDTISHDMNLRNNHNHTRKKRHELSVSASKTIKTEHVEIICTFN